ncbi:hypothetical protein WNY58_16335 [Neptuniibacter pectenicola]|uniref:Transposase n=1 Tax=Neptuniibacter pectenicola TaxID=1806669 RepID=A0ABU9TW54_9GAMM
MGCRADGDVGSGCGASVAVEVGVSPKTLSGFIIDLLERMIAVRPSSSKSS